MMEHAVAQLVQVLREVKAAQTAPALQREFFKRADNPAGE